MTGISVNLGTCRSLNQTQGLWSVSLWIANGHFDLPIGVYKGTPQRAMGKHVQIREQMYIHINAGKQTS